MFDLARGVVAELWRPKLRDTFNNHQGTGGG